MLKKVREELEKLNNTLSIEEGDYISVFKRIGERKSVTKTLNIKPDFIIHEVRKGYSYAFIIRNAFDAFKVLNKFLLFKELGMPFNYKTLYFFVEEEEELYLNEEHGVLRTEEKHTTRDLWHKIQELVNGYERELDKRVILRMIE